MKTAAEVVPPVVRGDRPGTGAAAQLKTLRASGALHVGAGLAISGAAAYAFLGIEAHVLGPVRYAPFAVYWSLLSLLGPGVFGALEAEAGRTLTVAAATDDRSAPVMGRILVVAGILVAVLATAAVAGAGGLRHLFDGSDFLVGCLIASFMAFATEFTSLGVAAGNRRFGAYGVVVSGEGITRLVLGAVVLAAGVESVGAVGACVAAAPLLAAVCGMPWLRRAPRRGPDVPVRRLLASAPGLIIAALLANVIVSAGPIAVRALAASPAQATEAAPFLSALLLVKVPLFLFSAAAPVLMPSMVRSLASNDAKGLRRSMALLLAGDAVIGAGFVLGAVALGPPILRVLFGHGFVLDRSYLGLVALSVPVIIATTVVGSLLVALRKEYLLAASWLIGCLVMGATVAAISPLVERVALGMVSGAAAALLSATAGVVHQLRRGRQGRVGLAVGT